jgi:hypothetical protein
MSFQNLNVPDIFQTGSTKTRGFEASLTGNLIDAGQIAGG